MSVLFGLNDSIAGIAVEVILNSMWQGAILASLIWLLLRFFKRAVTM
jgi:hypothetical protein